MLSFKDYLKKYSAINKKFLNEYFKIRGEDNTFDEIKIDLSQVATFLGAAKSSLKSTVVNSYLLDFDYKIINKDSTGGRPSELILLSYTCFKRMCILSRSKRGDEVRTYFLEIEQNLIKYSKYIEKIYNKN